MKRCVTSGIIKETQIKITVRNHLKLVRTADIKKIRDRKCLGECGEKKPLYTTGRNVNCNRFPGTYGKQYEVPQKIKTILSLLGKCPKEIKSYLKKKYTPFMFTAALFAIVNLCPLMDE